MFTNYASFFGNIKIACLLGLDFVVVVSTCSFLFVLPVIDMVKVIRFGRSLAVSMC